MVPVCSISVSSKSKNWLAFFSKWLSPSIHASIQIRIKKKTSLQIIHKTAEKKIIDKFGFDSDSIHIEMAIGHGVSIAQQIDNRINSLETSCHRVIEFQSLSFSSIGFVYDTRFHTHTHKNSTFNGQVVAWIFDSNWPLLFVRFERGCRLLFPCPADGTWHNHFKCVIRNWIERRVQFGSLEWLKSKSALIKYYEFA